eukprot:CAMPEP_0197469114 /NCGR_PEP_ID=MMETSP1175-20131217/66437_1 /TAXON_ID=1003142 /ORGANISM="Triceratium dubium, Strain CCMP147" /LENGTH=251 /DNA_ID=CAMNT_0043005247 /DNA_START=549 /DNA_END=1302 /DNA_ORIENTATION=+
MPRHGRPSPDEAVVHSKNQSLRQSCRKPPWAASRSLGRISDGLPLLLIDEIDFGQVHERRYTVAHLILNLDRTPNRTLGRDSVDFLREHSNEYRIAHDEHAKAVLAKWSSASSMGPKDQVGIRVSRTEDAEASSTQTLAMRSKLVGGHCPCGRLPLEKFHPSAPPLLRHRRLPILHRLRVAPLEVRSSTRCPARRSLRKTGPVARAWGFSDRSVAVVLEPPRRAIFGSDVKWPAEESDALTTKSGDGVSRR